MLPAARIVVIDDDLEDLQAIIIGLQAAGSVALGLHYPEMDLRPCPVVRIVFLDLHLLPAKDTAEQIPNTIGILAQLLGPDHGPYAVVLWSDHPDYQEQFEAECRDRLTREKLPLPLKVLALAKTDHFQPDVQGGRALTDPIVLKERVLESIGSVPQLAALLAWEDQVSQAADDTIRQIFQIARKGEDPGESLSRCMGDLAVASAGHKVAEENVFRAVNAVLVPVLADRLLHRNADGADDLWKRAVPQLQTTSSFSPQDKASWNRFLHVELGDRACRPWERGSLINLTAWSERKFLAVWGSSKTEILQGLKLEVPLDEVQWLMVQIQAACDHAQQNSGLLPFLLGLKLSASTGKMEKWRKEKKTAQYLWFTPTLGGQEEPWWLLVHLRYGTGISKGAAANLPVLGRLREQLLTNLTHQVHSYGGRPGIVEL